MALVRKKIFLIMKKILLILSNLYIKSLKMIKSSNSRLWNHQFSKFTVSNKKILFLKFSNYQIIQNKKTTHIALRIGFKKIYILYITIALVRNKNFSDNENNTVNLFRPFLKMTKSAFRFSKSSISWLYENNRLSPVFKSFKKIKSANSRFSKSSILKIYKLSKKKFLFLK